MKKEKKDPVTVPALILRETSQWAKKDEIFIARSAVAIFFVMILSNLVYIGLEEFGALYSYVTFAFPCAAAIIGGAAIYLDDKDKVWSKAFYMASYFLILISFFYFIWNNKEIQDQQKARLFLVLAPMSCLTVINYIVRRRTRTTIAKISLAAHIFGVIAIILLFINL